MAYVVEMGVFVGVCFFVRVILEDRTDFDADAFFFFGGRACAGAGSRA